MWRLCSICANSFPLLSLSLASVGDKQLGNTLASDSVAFLLSPFVLLLLEDDQSTDPCCVCIVLPLMGLSSYDCRGGPRHTPVTNLSASASFLYLCLCLYHHHHHLSPASSHPGMDFKFHSKAAISAPLAKWVIILLAMPTLNLYKCSHSSNSFPAS